MKKYETYNLNKPTNTAVETKELQMAIADNWIVLQGTQVLSSGANKEKAVILELFHPKKLMTKEIRYRSSHSFDLFLANLRVPGLSLAE